MLGKIKAHFVEHKELYIGLGIGVGVAGITAIIVRGRHAEVQRVSDEDPSVKRVIVRPLNILSNRPATTSSVVTVIERDGRGHPGYITRNLETNRYFPSQTKAAEEFDIPLSVMSDHIRGKFEDANGLHFERIVIPKLEDLVA